MGKQLVSFDKAYQLLAHGRWFSPGTPASSTSKTSLHDIAEILLKMALNTKNQIKKSSLICLKTAVFYNHYNEIWRILCRITRKEVTKEIIRNT
jgi:hypothetical protein